MKRKGAITIYLFLIIFFQLFIFGVVEAKDFPEKPIRLLVGMSPGSSTDLGARALAKVAPKYLGKQLVVVNLPGGATTVALNELIQSPPDGYTISTLTTSYTSVTIHTQQVPFDPKVLKFLLTYGELRQVLYVQGKSPYIKVRDLVAYGQKNPGTITYGIAGRGNTAHLQGMLFFRSAKISAHDVPFKGSAEITSAVLGGHVIAGIGDISGVLQQVRAGGLKPVVAFTDQRLEEVPDVPTSKEGGYTDAGALSPLVGIGYHRDTPPDRIKVLHDGLKKAVEDPEFKKIIASLGLKCEYRSPEDVDANNAKAEKIVVPLLKELKIFVQ